jgi:hypothetical protein
MNPETKLVLDAPSKRFDDMEAKWEQSFKDVGEKLEKEFGEVEDEGPIRRPEKGGGSEWEPIKILLEGD